MKGLAVLQRAIYVSDAVGSAGQSILSIAQILGASDINNRRDELRSLLIFHKGKFLQLIEGRRADLDRLFDRLRADPRHENIRMLIDEPLAGTQIAVNPMARVSLTAEVEAMIGDRALNQLSLGQAQALFVAGAAQRDLAA